MRNLLPERMNGAARRRPAGLTILEMLVSTAMLSLIVLSLTAVFIQTQKAFKMGIKAATVTDAGRTILDMVASDVRQMSDGAKNGVTNFYWSWTENSRQLMNNLPFRTNQVDAIYMLVHTNTMWMGVGYAVQNLVPKSGMVLGTLYRYETNFQAPYLLTNNLFWPFQEAVQTQNFTNSPSWHRVADGVVSLKVWTYDQNGNEPWVESTWTEDYAPEGAIAYPLTSNTLPNAVDVELAILEPDALARARAMANNPNLAPFTTFMETNALTTMEIFRRRVGIPIVAR